MRSFCCPKFSQPASTTVQKDIANCISMDEIRDAPKPTPCIVDEIPQPLIVLNPDHGHAESDSNHRRIPTSIRAMVRRRCATTCISGAQLSFVVQPSLVGRDHGAGQGAQRRKVQQHGELQVRASGDHYLARIDHQRREHGVRMLSRPVTWAIVGGVDAAQFEIVGSNIALHWPLAGGTRGFGFGRRGRTRMW